MRPPALQMMKERCPELASFFDSCCERDLRFDGPYPITHSAHNHVHLWALEYWAERQPWIDLSFRTDFARAILARWEARLSSFATQHPDGFRLYLYQDLAPTVSVVAETAMGCPYGGRLIPVRDEREIMALYTNKPWSRNFATAGNDLTPSRVLRGIEQNAGSISAPTAQSLGVKIGALRLLIEQLDLTVEVNAIRKRFKRRPAQFRNDLERQFATHIYEKRVCFRPS